MGTPLAGQVIAIIARGSEADRAIAVALAEAGADIAIATLEHEGDQEFATASIANEVWAIGRDQFSHVLNATNPAAVRAFIDRCGLALGGCEAVVVASDGEPPGAVLAAVLATMNAAVPERRIAVGFEAPGFETAELGTIVELLSGA